MTVLLPHGASVLRSEEPGEALSLSWNKGISREAPGRPAVADAVSCGKAADESSFRWAGSCRTCAVEGKRRRSSTERTGVDRSGIRCWYQRHDIWLAARPACAHRSAANRLFGLSQQLSCAVVRAVDVRGIARGRTSYGAVGIER